MWIRHNTTLMSLLWRLKPKAFLDLHWTVFVESGEISAVGRNIWDVLSCPHQYTTLNVNFLSALVATKHKDVSITSPSGLGQ